MKLFRESPVCCDTECQSVSAMPVSSWAITCRLRTNRNGDQGWAITMLLSSWISLWETRWRQVQGSLCTCRCYHHNMYLSMSVYAQYIPACAYPVWAWGNTFPLIPSLSHFPTFYSIFYFSLVSFLLTSSIFLLFHPLPFYQNSPTPFPGTQLNLALVFCLCWCYIMCIL